MGVAAEASLTFDVFNKPRHYIDVFNQGQAPFEFTAAPSEPWIVLSETHGAVEKDRRLWVSVDWTKIPRGSAAAIIETAGPNAAKVSVRATAFNPYPRPYRDFVQAEWFVSME